MSKLNKSLSVPLLNSDMVNKIQAGKYGFAASEEMIAKTLRGNETIIIDVDYIKNAYEEYYVIYLIDEEPVDFEHWESVENLFKELNFTACWVSEKYYRPKSDIIRWVEDSDDLESNFYTKRSQFI